MLYNNKTIRATSSVTSHPGKRPPYLTSAPHGGKSFVLLTFEEQTYLNRIAAKKHVVVEEKAGRTYSRFRQQQHVELRVERGLFHRIARREGQGTDALHICT